ncbi:MAG: NTP transferase domain-containing protein [Bdellovibrionales bacterium]
MQIIIPMSGSGERFRRAGYAVPKPLIDIGGKPMIAHVVALFPGETDFLFICNRDHLADPELRMPEAIRKYCPSGKIIGIAPHKLGPVHAVMQAADHIDLGKPALVSYCDYGAVWDYAAFKKMVNDTQCDGAVVGYTGFHPHMLRDFRYGYVRKAGELVIDIREKQPYTDIPMNEIALCGAYYFRSAATMLQSFRELAAQNEFRIGGEHYVSLAYKSMLAKGADIRSFLLDRFMQWGTPEDLEDYLYYAGLFHAAAKRRARARHAGLLVMPMAGQGRRFMDAGYEEPKPLVPVDGRPMAARALADLPETPQARIVLRRDLPQMDRLKNELPKYIPGMDVVMLDALTEGQAITALAALDGVSDDTPVTIAACDNGLIYDAGTFTALFSDTTTDVIVWGARGYPFARRNPRAYGWIDADAAGKIKNISVKSPLADTARDPIVTGAFTFARAGDFRLAVKRMIERDARVNGEFYIDTAVNDAIALGLNCRLFSIDYYLGWGTPDELRVYEYWQKYFEGVGLPDHKTGKVNPCQTHLQLQTKIGELPDHMA